MASKSSFVQPSILKFEGHYDHWAMLMENFLRSKEKSIDDQKLKDLKAKNYLFQALDRSVLETILNKETTKDIWDSLKQKYQGTSRVKHAQLQALRKEFEILHMKEGESVNDYFARTLTIANKMKANGENKGNVVVVEKILRSMTPKFDYVVCSIEESKDTDTLTIDELQSSLLVHEQRMTSHVEEEHALKVSHGDQYAQYEERGRGRGDWGDKDVEAVVEEENETGHESDHNTDTEEEDNISSDSVAEESTSSSNQRRCRRPPLWMEDFETGEGLSKGNT
ncbi:gag-polypeptide of LTR copia-type [Sesbania bispinosa]|nr:gag-polypeptide of LTR copia-type [Sesbania bispinosa]